MPRLNTGVQGSPIVATVAAKDRLADGVQGSPVFIGTAVAPTRTTTGAQGSPITRASGSDPDPDAPTPTELAHVAGCSYLASSTYFSTTPSAAFDSNATTAWLGQNNGVDWLSVDIGREKYAKPTSYSVQIKNTELTRAPRAWTFQGSNDHVAWTTIDTQANQTDWSGLQVRTFTVSTTSQFRFFRLNITQNNGDSTYVQVAEFTVYGVVASSSPLDVFSPVNMTTLSAPSPYVASASSTYAGTSAFHPFDGSDSTVWMSNGASPWLKIDLGAARGICVAYEILLGATEPARAPRDWTLDGSNDDSAWATLDTVSGQTGWLATERRLFTCDTATTAYRYYRLSISLNNEANQYTRLGGLYLYK